MMMMIFRQSARPVAHMKIKKERQLADGKDGGTGGGARGLVLYKSLNTLWCVVSTRGKRDECKMLGGAPQQSASTAGTNA